ncbi:purine permease [candidate division KSB1 bacterium]|nr:purine permease [candidate division KSB1 bacterium]
MKNPKPQIAYGIDDLPPLREAVPLGLQHILAMFLSNIAVPLIIATAIGLNSGEKAFLVQMVLVMAGVSTIIQSYPIGPVGARMPIVMGTSFAFVAGIIIITKEYNLATAFGACFAAAFVEVVIGFSYTKFQRFFPPLATGIVVMLIGLTLVPVGMDYAAGGVGSPDYGSMTNLTIAGVVLLITLFLNQFSKGFLSYASMIIGVVVGYLLALSLGKVDLAQMAAGGWFSFPRPLKFGLEFHLAPILTMSFIYVVSALETMGDIAGTTAAVDRNPTSKEMKGGLVADGLMSALAALFSAFPNTSYSQNVGLVNFTGVVSRHVTAIGGGFLVLLGLIPKVGVLVATIPAPVIGGGALIMFAMIFTSGMAIIHRNVDLNKRSMIIIAASVALGLGVEYRPEVLQHFPQAVKSLLSQGLVVGGLTGFILNLIFPEKSK